MRITKEEQEIRRNRMLHVAYDLFSEFGIRDVSLARIAAAAGVSSNSIFRYFESKAILVQQTQDILWQEVVDYITNSNQPAISKSKNGLEEMRILLRGFEKLYKNHSKYLLFSCQYKAYLLENKIKLPAGEIDRSLSQINRIFMHALERGQADGSIIIDYSAPELFTFIWGPLRYFVEQLAVHSKISHGENPGEAILPLILDRIATDLGRGD